jgi:hypothetical protein
MKTIQALTLLAIMSILTISSCRKKEVAVKVQFINALPYSGYPDFYLQGDKQASFIGMGLGSNSHTADLLSGEPLTLEIKSPNTGITLLASSIADWQAGTHYTYVMYGDTASLQGTWLRDTAAWPAAGHFKVRFSHFASDAPALDVFYNNDTVAFNRVYFGTDSTQALGDFVELPAGTYTVRVKDHNTGQTYLLQPNIGIQSNRMLELFTTGLMSDSVSAFFQLGTVAR